jgi:hypothetical protein
MYVYIYIYVYITISNWIYENNYLSHGTLPLLVHRVQCDCRWHALCTDESQVLFNSGIVCLVLTNHSVPKINASRSLDMCLY